VLPTLGKFSYNIQRTEYSHPANEQEAIEALVGIGRLYPAYIGDNPQVLYCPSRKRDFTFDGDWGWATQWPLHTPPNDAPDGGTINCSYIYLWDTEPDTTIKLNKLKNRALTVDLFQNGYGQNGHKTAYNISYFDGSVKCFMDPEMYVIEWSLTLHDSAGSGVGSNHPSYQLWWNVFSDYYFSAKPELPDLP